MTRFNPSLPILTHMARKTTAADSVARKTLAPDLNRSSQDSEADDPITLEPIRSYDPADIFTTLEGKKYHLPSLKCWLQHHDTLPHNRSEAHNEIERIWPHTAAARLRKTIKKYLIAGTAVTAAGSVASGLIFRARSGPRRFASTTSSYSNAFYAEAVERCLRTGGGPFSTCVNRTVPQVMAQWARDVRIFGAIIGCFLGVTLGLMVATIYVHVTGNKYGAQRSITAEERLKAGQGQ